MALYKQQIHGCLSFSQLLSAKVMATAEFFVIFHILLHYFSHGSILSLSSSKERTFFVYLTTNSAITAADLRALERTTIICDMLLIQGTKGDLEQWRVGTASIETLVTYINEPDCTVTCI